MAVTLGPRTSVSAPWPTPDNATARTGIGNIWDFLSEMTSAPEVDITCAATLDIGGQNSAKLRLTGASIPITSFGTKYRSPVFIRISNTYLIQHNSTSLICPGNRNLTVSAGDHLVAVAKSDVSGTANGWQLSLINKGDGGALFSGQVRIIGNQPIAFEGVTDDAYQTIIQVTEPTADRIITIPNANVDLSTIRSATTTLPGNGRVATWAEAQAAAIGGNVFLNPDSLNWSRSFAVSGYMKFPGTPGLIWQWGSVAGVELPSSVTVRTGTFPIAFPSAVLSVLPVIDTNGGNATQVVSFWDRAGTTLTTPKFWVQEMAAGNQSSWSIAYQAIGF